MDKYQKEMAQILEQGRRESLLVLAQSMLSEKELHSLQHSKRSSTEIIALLAGVHRSVLLRLETAKKIYHDQRDTIAQLQAQAISSLPRRGFQPCGDIQKKAINDPGAWKLKIENIKNRRGH